MAADLPESSESDPPALFCAVGIELPRQAGPSAAERIGVYFQRIRPRRPILLSTANAEVEPLFRQQRLSLEPAQLAPAKRSEWLDYGVYDVFRDIECARAAALALEAAGFRRIGRLLELSEGQFARSRHMTQAALDAMKTRLQSAGLQLGRCAGDSHAASQGRLRRGRPTVVR